MWALADFPLQGASPILAMLDAAAPASAVDWESALLEPDGCAENGHAWALAARAAAHALGPDFAPVTVGRRAHGARVGERLVTASPRDGEGRGPRSRFSNVSLLDCFDAGLLSPARHPRQTARHRSSRQNYCV